MKEPSQTLDEIVPGRLTSAELRAMALRQQQQIDSQHQLLATKEQRLRFLKSQEMQNAIASAEGERLRRLRERVEAQESKLRRLRALRGQVDLQKTYNVTLSNDLDSIRALFSEKEKELSLAVAKVEALTRQLEDLRRDRRCSITLISGANNSVPPFSSQASRELEKLRRELMYRNQLSLQQDARLHLQREALQQRQAELRSVDQRIFELQNRLQRKRAATNVQTQNHHQHQLFLQQQQHLLQQQQQQLQQHPSQHQHQHHLEPDFQTADAIMNSNLVKPGLTSLKQPNLTVNLNTDAQQNYGRPHTAKFSTNNLGRDQNRAVRGNVAAVEPYIHTPQKTKTSVSIPNHSAATANTNQQNKLIQDLTHVKLGLMHASPNPHSSHTTSNTTNTIHYFSGESDESKLAKKKLTIAMSANILPESTVSKTSESDSSKHIYAEIGPKKRDLIKEVTTDNHSEPAIITQITSAAAHSSRIPKSILSSVSTPVIVGVMGKPVNPSTGSSQTSAKPEKFVDDEKNTEVLYQSEITEGNSQQLTVHSVPLTSVNKSVATALSNAGTTSTTTTTAAASVSVSVSAPGQLSSCIEKSNRLQSQQPSTSGSYNLDVPPRKPISSVAPTTSTSATSSIPKIIAQSPKINRVAPSVVTSSTDSVAPPLPALISNADRPALPPKPIKMSIAESAVKKTSAENHSVMGLQTTTINDNLPIKPKPLTIRKQPMSEQPRLKFNGTVAKPPLQLINNRKSDLAVTSSTNSFLHPEAIKNEPSLGGIELSNSPNSSAEYVTQYSPSANNESKVSVNVGTDELDKAENTNNDEEKSPDSLKKRIRSNANPISCTGKPKLTRRVSFDPLALLLDASLEGELELVKKTAQQVTNPSAANDEGITALHNAICAGHFDIVKFLVEFGCDVNAQDSDGWTPLHCAASCNNLSMVKFLVENGACLFAATLSDHETPAEKCEEDEEGFDGCSEYLYSIQEKLGILHGGEVFAVFAYEAQNTDELTFDVNERIIILRKGDDAENEWWWAKNATDQEGYIPRNLLGLYPRVPPQYCNARD